MLLKVSLTVSFLWGVALLVGGWVISRRQERSAFHFWFALIASEAARWSLTAFLIQSVGIPVYLSGLVIKYPLEGLYWAMGVMGTVLLVGLYFFLREKRFWPGGYYTAITVVGLLALVTVWLLLV